MHGPGWQGNSPSFRGGAGHALLRRRSWPGMLQDASFFHPAATLSAASAA